jgi:hypothetical protein
VATPEMRNTGAIASWMTCAMAEIGVSDGMPLCRIPNAEAQSESVKDHTFTSTFD